MSKPSIKVNVDSSEAGFATGIMAGVARTAKTRAYLGDSIKYTHSVLSERFDESMDVLAEHYPHRFSHVFEWESGSHAVNPNDRLWSHVLSGGGASRTATWTWKSSVKPIPTPQERAQNFNDPISMVPQKNLDKLSKRRYIFYWKAPIMEYDIPVNIYPKYSNVLFIPTGKEMRPFAFSHGFRNLHPGGKNNTGQFSAAWTTWWGSSASKAFDEEIAPVLESDMASVEAGIRMAKRTRARTMSLSTSSSFHEAFAQGSDWAEHWLKERMRRRVRSGR